MDRAELRADEFLDEHLQVTLDTGDADAQTEYFSPGSYIT